MHGRDILAGAVLLNAIPHTIMGLAGKRCMTPLGGANSSPTINIVWAGLNFLTGVAALGPGTWRSIDQRSADERLRALTLGIVGMAALSAVYELTPSAAHHRLLRATLASSTIKPASPRSPACGASRA